MHLCYLCIVRCFQHIHHQTLHSYGKYYKYYKPVATSNTCLWQFSRQSHVICSQNSQQVEDLILSHPSLGNKSKLRPSHYVLDTELAGSISRTIFKNKSTGNCMMIELNPGPGILTKAFFQSGFKHVVGLESKPEFVYFLQNLQQHVGLDQLQYYNFDLFVLWQRESSVTQQDIKYRETEVDIIDHFSEKGIPAGDSVSVFGCLPEYKEYPFLAYLVKNISLKDGIFSVANLEWFLFVSIKIYRGLQACLSRKATMVHYNKLAIILFNFFDYKVLMVVPGSAFAPPYKNKRKSKVDANTKYLLQLTPKCDLDKILPPHDIRKYMSFLKQILFKKKGRLIPRMEQLVPGSGVQLIKDKHSMTEQVSDLSPSQLLNVYKSMQTWPEYQGSPMQFYLTERSEILEDEETQELIGTATEHVEN